MVSIFHDLKIVLIYTTEYDSALKKKEFLTYDNMDKIL